MAETGDLGDRGDFALTGDLGLIGDFALTGDLGLIGDFALTGDLGDRGVLAEGAVRAVCALTAERADGAVLAV